MDGGQVTNRLKWWVLGRGMGGKSGTDKNEQQQNNNLFAEGSSLTEDCLVLALGAVVPLEATAGT